jgi:soluble lytic murein transglycosylase-like protein
LRTEAQILEPGANLRTGFRYLREMIDRYGGDVRLGVLAYNRGEGAVDRALRAGRDPENGYSPKVLGGAENRYSGKGILSGREDRQVGNGRFEVLPAGHHRE